MPAEPGNDRYGDMLYMPHHRSATHPPMSAHDRAAQFSPFAALTGHSAAIEETGRLTEEKNDLDETRAEELDARMQQLCARIDEMPEALVTYFVPDARKRGGQYHTLLLCVRRIDYDRRLLCPVQGDPIAFENLLQIEIPDNSVQP